MAVPTTLRCHSARSAETNLLGGIIKCFHAKGARIFSGEASEGIAITNALLTASVLWIKANEQDAGLAE